MMNIEKRVLTKDNIKSILRMIDNDLVTGKERETIIKKLKQEIETYLKYDEE